MEPHLRRVSVLSAGVGAGHIRAGLAVQAELQRRLPGGTVVKQDVLEHAGPGFRAMYRDAYVALASRTPRLIGWLYDRADEPWQNRWYAGLIERLALRGWMRELLRDPPEVAVCTHFLPAAMLCHLRRHHGLPTRIATVVTDLDVHGLWLGGRADVWCVAGEEAREIMVAAGVPADTVRVTGIPIHAEFANLPGRDDARAQLGIDGIRPLVLFSTGGCCLGPVERTFGQLLALRDMATVVAICGHNERARANLTAMIPLGSEDRVKVVGFTNEMHRWMAAADLLVGKPGGITSSEARAAGLPMAAIHPIPGQEERNLAHLLEWGAAIACHTPATLAWRVRGLLQSPARLAAMRHAARASARPHATNEVADTVLELASSSVRAVYPTASVPSGAIPATS
ncbi:MAG: MGDG synthase family glycosyltransferase [Phycisphaerales bacterium]|jgi:processive 1,2-diacylglycerol beta-glucosyltransferase